MGIGRPGSRRWCIAAGIAAVLLLVWTSAQLSGLMVHGAWPRVSFLWSPVEVVRVLTGHEPAADIPSAPFWLCLVLEFGTGLLVALRVRHRLRSHHGHVWVPRPPEGIAKPHSFRDGYRRLVAADAAQAAKVSASGVEPARAAGVGVPRPEVVGALDVERFGRLLAAHLSREQLGALIGELAERRMTGETPR